MIALVNELLGKKEIIRDHRLFEAIALFREERIHSCARDEACVTVVRVLLGLERIDEAREIMSEIEGDFWRAEAWTAIASHTEDPSDFRQAFRSASRVNASSLREEVVEKLKMIRQASNSTF